jgi:hypothetical protein
MPSSQTPNYNLNQWSKDDRVLMEDFNADNAKIDAAIKAVDGRVDALSRRSRFTKLWELTLTASSTEITIPLTGVSWSRWDKVHLDILATNGSQMEIYFNEYVWDTQVFHIANSRPNFLPRYTFYPGFSADRQLVASHLGTWVNRKEPISSLKQLVIQGSTMQAGAKFILWGEE